MRSYSFARQVAIGIGAPHALKQRIFVPLFATAHGDHLLRQDVERRGRNVQAIEIALPDGANRRRTFQQVVARGGKQPSLGDRSAPVTGTTYALQRDRNRARRVDLADEIDRTDVDT